jgi:hypothetical protein
MTESMFVRFYFFLFAVILHSVRMSGISRTAEGGAFERLRIEAALHASHRSSAGTF